MARQIGGDVIQLHGLVPEGTNSHTFHPTPGDVRYLAEADVVILNGLSLEVPIENLARSSGKADAAILKLGDHTISREAWVFDFSFPEAYGHPNPHLWLNVAHAMTYTTLIRDQLSRLDPSQATTYTQNAARYLRQLVRLDQCIAAGVATIPAAQRKLLTYHDSWPYFARRYGMTVMGAVQPANFSEPSAREVARIIEQIRHEHVPAIFGSEVFPSRVLETIARETGVQYVDTLRDDSLPGQPGEAQHGYIGMMLVNVATMVQVLGGNPEAFASCTAALLSTKE
jgi:ABC-type Zn uptake system ZnuABC Zn-binding protein ZnuA